MMAESDQEAAQQGSALVVTLMSNVTFKTHKWTEENGMGGRGTLVWGKDAETCKS